MHEALDMATLPADRGRLRVLIGAIETERGIGVDELVDEVTEVYGGSEDVEDQFALFMATSNVALAVGDAREASTGPRWPQRTFRPRIPKWRSTWR